MMGCFSTSHTDGTEEAFRMSLRSLLATKETPIPTPCIAKQIIERKLGFGTRKTLQARTNLLDTACHSLAKAKQRSLVSLPPSYYIKSDVLLFPLPLPPGYKPTNNGKLSTKSISGSVASRKLLTTGSSNSASRKLQVDVKTAVSNVTSKVSSKDDALLASEGTSSFNSNCTCSPGHSSSNSTTTCLLCSCEALTPTSPTSSSTSTVFSAATSSLSQSSSFNSSSTTYSDLRFNSLCQHVLEEENGSSFFLPYSLHRSAELALRHALREFSSMEIARALQIKCRDECSKLADGAVQGPTFYKVFLPEEKSSMVITRAATKLSRKKWRVYVQALSRLAHSNVSKVIGFSYERAKYHGMEGMRRNHDNLGFIVYEDNEDESLEEFLQDVEKGIDWLTRLKLAIGIIDGLSYLLENMPSYVAFGGDLSLRNIRVDFSLRSKLFDFVVPTSNMGASKEHRVANLVQSLGNVLLKVFGFVSYPQDGESQRFRPTYHYKPAYPLKDAKVVIDLIASCLLPEASLRPSIRQVAGVLRSIEPTQHVAKYSLTRSKSFTYRKKRSLSFG